MGNSSFIMANDTSLEQERQDKFQHLQQSQDIFLTRESSFSKLNRSNYKTPEDRPSFVTTMRKTQTTTTTISENANSKDDRHEVPINEESQDSYQPTTTSEETESQRSFSQTSFSQMSEHSGKHLQISPKSTAKGTTLVDFQESSVSDVSSHTRGSSWNGMFMVAPRPEDLRRQTSRDRRRSRQQTQKPLTRSPFEARLPLHASESQSINFVPIPSASRIELWSEGRKIGYVDCGRSQPPVPELRRRLSETFSQTGSSVSICHWTVWMFKSPTLTAQSRGETQVELTNCIVEEVNQDITLSKAIREKTKKYSWYTHHSLFKGHQRSKFRREEILPKVTNQGLGSSSLFGGSGDTWYLSAEAVSKPFGFWGKQRKHTLQIMDRRQPSKSLQPQPLTNKYKIIDGARTSSRNGAQSQLSLQRMVYSQQASSSSLSSLRSLTGINGSTPTDDESFASTATSSRYEFCASSSPFVSETATPQAGNKKETPSETLGSETITIAPGHDPMLLSLFLEITKESYLPRRQNQRLST